MNSITIIVIALGAWGKGDTYEWALVKCVEAGGWTVKPMKVLAE